MVERNVSIPDDEKMLYRIGFNLSDKLVSRKTQSTGENGYGPASVTMKYSLRSSRLPLGFRKINAHHARSLSKSAQRSQILLSSIQLSP